MKGSVDAYRFGAAILGSELDDIKGDRTRMPTPIERASAYLSKLEDDRKAVLQLSKEKADEAKIIKARQEGFQDA